MTVTRNQPRDNSTIIAHARGPCESRGD